MALEIVKHGRGIALACAVVALPGMAMAQSGQAQKPSSGPVIYPSKGQSPEQQAQDKSACQAWATQQTGYDPLAAAEAQQAQAQQKGGGAVRGGARGAAAGAAIGAVAGDAGKGAAIGATAGGIGGAVKKRQQAAAQQQAGAQQLAEYQKAFGTCMQGRGYAVSGK